MMSVAIDFSLSDFYDVVEQTIFALVLKGIKDVRTISMLLSLYSDEVIANAIKKLVNHQILTANLQTRTLDLSGTLHAVIEGCLGESQDLELPESLVPYLDDGNLYISDEDTKRKILNNLLPGVNIGFLVNSIDFAIRMRGMQDEQ